MHDAETRALRRAAILLLVVSSGRWSMARIHDAGAPTAEPSVLDSLAEAVDEAVDEQERRGRPLAEGERIDPNSAEDVELDRLPGIGAATAEAIVAARDDGLTFGRAEDLEAVRGVGPATVERLRPFLDVRGVPARVRVPPRPPELLNLNRAAPDELERLPGIGPALAERIVRRRREHLFASVDDLLDVRGIGPTTLDRLRPLVAVR
jgi:competence protein ComEA